MIFDENEARLNWKLQVAGAFAASLASLLAASPGLAEPKPLPSHAPDLDQVVGVYKDRFANGDVQGDTFTSENVFELVRITGRTAYFRIHGEFYNGHTCDLWGVADLERDALTYHGPPDDRGAPCTLKISVNSQGVILNDVDGHCRDESCGERGGYGFGTSVDYPFKSRRPIRYMPLILKSSEYASAVKEHSSRPLEAPNPPSSP